MTVKSKRTGEQPSSKNFHPSEQEGIKMYNFPHLCTSFGSNERMRPDLKNVPSEISGRFIEINGNPTPQRKDLLKHWASKNFPHDVDILVKVVDQLDNFSPISDKNANKAIACVFYKNYLAYLAGLRKERPDFVDLAAFIADRHMLMVDQNTTDLKIYNTNTGIFDEADSVLRRIIISWVKYLGFHWSISLETAVIEILKRKLPTMPDSDYRYYGFDNMDLDTKTMAFVEHAPEHYLLNGSDVVVDTTAQAPVYSQTVKQWFPDDPDSIATMHEYMGYVLSPSFQANKLLICLGPGSNGKSVFGHVLTKLVGVTNVSSVSIGDLKKDFALQPLIGKRLNLADETSTMQEFDSTRIKTLTSGGQLSVNRKNKTEIAMHLPIKQVYMMNDIPPMLDRSFAFMRRINLLKFGHIFTPDQQDRDLNTKLDQELSGILNIVVDALKRLVANDYQFTESETSKKEIKKIFAIEDPVDKFCNEMIRHLPQHKVESGIIHDTFVDWCKVKQIPLQEYNSRQKFWAQFRDNTVRKFGLDGQIHKSNGSQLIHDIALNKLEVN